MCKGCPLSESAALQVHRLDSHNPAQVARWEAFVAACPQATFFHRAGWQTIIREVFRQKMAAIGRFVQVCEPVEVDMGEAHRAFDVIRAEAFVAGFEAAYRRDPANS